MRNARVVKRRNRPVYTPPLVLPKREFRPKRIIAAIGMLGVIIILIYGFFYSGLFKITTIKVNGNSVTSSNQIIQEVNRTLASSFWGGNIVLANGSGIANALSSQNYQFSKVEVNKRGLHTLIIGVEERAGTLLWQTNNQLYILSSDGKIIEQVSGQKPNNMSVIRDNANLPVKLGDHIVTEGFVKFVQNIQTQLPSASVKIQNFSVTETTNELYVTVDAGYQINFDTNRSVEDQIRDFKAVLAFLAKQQKKPKQYVDVRISGKIFYQ